MRAVLQRVIEASVAVDGEVVGRIGPGLLVLLGVADDDTDADAVYLADKTADTRLFDGEPERSLSETGGAALVVSQFTLMGDCRKGRRPSWSRAARPEEANRLYEVVVERLRTRGIPTETGTFRARMAVRLTNDGPFTVLLDSRKTF
jgi:D-tyrosyl-tRNA(Tyr) deacylase